VNQFLHWFCYRTAGDTVLTSYMPKAYTATKLLCPANFGTLRQKGAKWQQKPHFGNFLFLSAKQRIVSPTFGRPIDFHEV